MKTNVRIISRMMTIAIAIAMTTTTAFADGGITDAYASGATNTPAGNYVVRTTGDIYHFQGEQFEVYKVYYDNPAMNMKIAAKLDGKNCRSFIAFSNDYTLFYECNKDGFGVRKIMFSNPDAHKKFNVNEYKQQTVLSEKSRIEKKQAIELIAGYLPSMKTM